MCRLFHLHQLITRTSRSYSYCFTFSNDAQEAATLFSDNRSEFEFCGWFGFWFTLAKRHSVLEFQASVVVSASRIVPLFIGGCSKIISSCILDWQVYRLANNDPSLFRLSTLTCLTTSALFLLNLFHSIMFPPIHHHVQEHLQFRRRHGFPARLRARRASR
jgi:hypothetical protein